MCSKKVYYTYSLYVTKVQKEEIEFQSVKTFLSSMERNSLSSRYTYENGLVHFHAFLSQKYPNYNPETILEPLLQDKINRYEVLDRFISYLQQLNLTPSSIRLYVASIRSYFAFNDVDVMPSKFKRKVKMPKLYREDEEPLDASDIRKILLNCNNRRLKAYLLLLASGGIRAAEGLAIRLCDIDFSVNPTKIHIRKEFAKTRVSRDIYISDEATYYLKQWIDWKYRDKGKNGHPKIRSNSDVIFSIYNTKGVPTPRMLYAKILKEFQKLLTIVGMDKRKEEGIQERRKITLHSFRRFVKTVISDQVNQDYSEWFLGHNKSPYYTKKEPERREIYATKCMKYLTFLDYTTLEARGKSIEANLREKDREIAGLKEKYEQDMEAMREEMNERFIQIMSVIQQNPKLAQIKPKILTDKLL
jgi:integrase